MSEMAAIVRLAHGGDGVTADGCFVPFTVPGDMVRIARDGARARILEVLTPGPARALPPCPHFRRCGGCALQHMAREPYLTWKREQVVNALAQRGFADVMVAEIVAVPPGTRRRAMFKAKGTSAGVELGFYAPDSRDVVGIQMCLILVPALEKLIAPLRVALHDILEPGETAELHATATESGTDLSLKLKRARTPDLLTHLARLAAELKLARLSWNGETVAQAAEPILRIGRFAVALPLEPFLQPTVQGERALQQLVRESAGGAKRVADLFAGCGTFALALAEGRHIHAVDQGGAMIEALKTAARAGGAGATLTTETRDLFRRPLLIAELARFDAVVLDPPRPGASAQARQLSQSRVPRIIYVSCNPASFARDARILAEGGYRLARAVPVDQFLWSPHVELVATFDRHD